MYISFLAALDTIEVRYTVEDDAVCDFEARVVE